MYKFTCKICGMHGTAAKQDDVPDDKHSSLTECFQAFREWVAFIVVNEIKLG